MSATLILVSALLGLSRQNQALDNFQSLANWKPIAADGVSLKLNQDMGRTGKSLRIDFDFNGHGGYVLAERQFAQKLPENFEFSFWLKAETPDNNFEFKVMDPSGQNVWWNQRAGYHWPTGWTRFVIRKRQIRWAWGPNQGPLTNAGSLQFGISAAAGGKGSVWIEDFQYRELPDVAPTPGAFTTTQDGKAAKFPLVINRPTDLSFARDTEFGGFTFEWASGEAPKSYRITTSEDGKSFNKTLKNVDKSLGGREVVFTPDSEAKYIRVETPKSSTAVLKDIKVLPVEAAESPAAKLTTIAEASPRGFYPRHLLNEQGFWTIVGSNGGKDEGLISEDGQVEIGKRLPCVDPFLLVDRKVFSWANTNRKLSLEKGYLPIPTVKRDGPLSLSIAPFATNDGSEVLYTTYKVTNNGTKRKQGTLVLAIHPAQVNPAWQALNNGGGFAPIHSLNLTSNSATINKNVRLEFSQTADRGFALLSEQGEISRYLAEGIFPKVHDAKDAEGLASGALMFRCDLRPGESRTISMRYGLNGTPITGGAKTDEEVAKLRAQTIESWTNTLSSMKISLPGAASRLADIAKTNVAYILVNRDGPEIHPGSRNYARAWMRDGSLMAAALLRFGRREEVKTFIAYYSKFVRPDGYVPCIVDHRGPETVVENDSHGEYLYLLAEYLRLTGDRTFIEKQYPVAERVAGYIQTQLNANKLPSYLAATDESHGFYGLMSPSISHEGYGNPEHSYWDDFFALKGLKDAAFLAQTFGHPDKAESYRASADDLRKNLTASMLFTAKFHNKNYIAGCAEFGDFDATSTSIALSPCDEQAELPQDLLKGTYEKYWDFCQGRITGRDKWDAYTPYEMRSLATYVRLGERSKALSLLKFFLEGVHPDEWNHWAEVVYPNPRTPKYIGDMPHTWCGSEYLRSFRDFFVYEQRNHLVVGAGVDSAWLEAKGMDVELPTAFGLLKLKGTKNAKTYRYEIRTGTDSEKITTDLMVSTPRDEKPKAVHINGKVVATANQVSVTELPAVVEFEY